MNFPEGLQSLFEDAPHAVILADPKTGNVVAANFMALETLGMRREELLGRRQCMLHHGEAECELLDVKFQKIVEGERVVPFESQVMSSDGRVLPVEIQMIRLRLGGKDLVYSSYRDISAQEEARKKLASSEAFLHGVLNAITETVMVIDTEFQVSLMNAAVRGILGESSRTGGRVFCYEVSHGRNAPCAGDEHPCPLRQVIATGQPVTVVHSHVKPDGSVIPFELTASPLFDDHGRIVNVIEIGRDISERLRFEEQRRLTLERDYQDEKERSLTTIAGGMAHDFNNLLTTVMGNAELLKLRLGPEGRFEQFIENITTSATKMAELTRQLLAYAKRGKYRPQVLFANSLVAEALKLCDAYRHDGPEVELTLADEPWSIYADRKQIHQMLINLMLNALEAMQNREGRVEVRVENVHRKEWECSHGDRHGEGDYVRIEIRDSGVGIPADQLPRIFEPFYTTHFFGRGLGLSAALGIVQNHGGCLSLTSRVRLGTTCTVHLPRVETPGETVVLPEDQRLHVRSQSVLIVDDDEAVLDLVGTMLREHGFAAECVLEGEQGLVRYRTDPERYSLVILDAKLADMEGNEVYQELKKINSDGKILMASGFDEETALAGMKLEAGDAYLQKPFSLEHLVDLVRRMTKR